MNSKKGSSSVFLMVILAALILIVFSLIHGVREESVSSRADAVINLAGDSILSEFDYDVQKEYGLFLLHGTDDELSEKLRSYVDYVFEEMEEVKVENVKVSATGFSVINNEIVIDQIKEHMKLIEAEGLFEKLRGQDDEESNSMPERTLRYGPAIVSLPSDAVPEKKLSVLAESIADNVSQVESVFSAGTEKFILNRYIMMHFNNRVHAVDKEHFFKNEAEYILGGKMSDRKNEKRMEIALKALRFPLNLAHIYSDAEKYEATMAMAQVLTPGAGAAATQAALASTWAYAEADNDVELLWQGSKVPMIKDKDTWAMDIDSAVEGVFGGTAKPAEEKGYDYEEYLQILLFFQDRNIKAARILDLIQINCRKNINRDFSIQEYAAGISVDAEINGKRYSYEKHY